MFGAVRREGPQAQAAREGEGEIVSSDESAERRARLVENARPHLDRLMGPGTEIGPASPGPLMCFPCLTNTCDHSSKVKASSVHGGGMIPAITALRGTLVCMDCAIMGARLAGAEAPDARL